MAPAGIVPSLDELEDGHARLGVGPKPTPVEKLAFQRREETLAHRIIVTIADRSGRRTDTGDAAAVAEGNRGVLRSLNGLLDRGWGKATQHMEAEISVYDSLSLDEQRALLGILDALAAERGDDEP